MPRRGARARPSRRLRRGLQHPAGEHRGQRLAGVRRGEGGGGWRKFGDPLPRRGRRGDHRARARRAPARGGGPGRAAMTRSALLFCLSLTWAGLAWSQEAGGFSAGPSSSPEPVYETRVESYRVSPPASQDRLFAGTRFWRLDVGHYEVETWWRT